MTVKEKKGVLYLVVFLFSILITAGFYSTIIQENNLKEKEKQLSMAMDVMKDNLQKENIKNSKLKLDSNATKNDCNITSEKING
jgi:Na+-translocating ferredoxin:NAD+ oxidoreductase RnfG subunit